MEKSGNKRDRELGLDAPITRRDFVQRSALATGLLATGSSAKANADYPPAKTGLRGSHIGSFEDAHALVSGADFVAGAASSEEDYDLVVVGAGVSGLAAAYFYRQNHPDARILILDNHDDFGGHAKRNEFVVDGRHVIGYGGSQSLEAPSDYSDTAKRLLRELMVDVDMFYDAFDQDFYVRHGLSTGIFFDKATYGRDALVPASFMVDAALIGFADSKSDPVKTIQSMPLQADTKAQLIDLYTKTEDKLSNVGLSQVSEYLYSKNYEAYLTEDVGITSTELVTLLRRYTTGYYGSGTDTVPAMDALLYGLPGMNKTGVWGAQTLRNLAAGTIEPYIFHFPDGNASIARLLVRSLIPDMSPQRSPNDVLLSQFDYSQLDRPENAVRIRLQSTALNVTNKKSGVSVVYRHGGKSTRIQAKKAILACYNVMVPHLVPELPSAQKSALAELVKIPLVYTNVVLRNWQAMKDAGVGFVYTPSSFHSYFMMDFPVDFPGYSFAKSPDDPVVLHFSEAPGQPGLPPKAQYRVGRGKLLATPFETIERDVRQTLAAAFGAFNFDPARDIAAITVNRWPHGYAYTYNPLFDPEYAAGQAPHEIGRATFGNIAIANSDAGARAYLDEAIDQAHRAAGEIS